MIKGHDPDIDHPKRLCIDHHKHMCRLGWNLIRKWDKIGNICWIKNMSFSHEFKETMSETWVIRSWPRYTDYIQDESGYPTLKGESYKLDKSKCDKGNGLVLTVLVWARSSDQRMWYWTSIQRKKSYKMIARKIRPEINEWLSHTSLAHEINVLEET